MRYFLQFLVILGLFIMVLTGCGFIESEKENERKDDILSPVNKASIDKDVKQNNNQDNEQSNEDTYEPAIDMKSKISFKEVFLSDQLFGNPEQFLTSIIPGFNINLSKEEAEKNLGKPDNNQTTQMDWGKEYTWVYDNIKGYQLTMIFSEDGYLSNFQLSKYFLTKGTITKVYNKSTPEPGEPIGYPELGFEDILLGATIDEILSGNGDPNKGYITYDEMYGYDLALVYQGITVHMSLEQESPYVHFIETNDLETIDTYRGVHTGSAVEDVIEKYGEVAYDWHETGDIIYATEDYWFAYKFIIENEKVVAIHIYEAS